MSKKARPPLTFIYEYDFGDSWEHDVVVEEHERIAVLVGERRLAAREFHFLEFVLATQAQVELGGSDGKVDGRQNDPRQRERHVERPTVEREEQLSAIGMVVRMPEQQAIRVATASRRVGLVPKAVILLPITSVALYEGLGMTAEPRFVIWRRELA